VTELAPDTAAILTAHDSLVLASMETPVEMQLVMDWLGQQRARNPEVKFDLSKLPELPPASIPGWPRQN
jgi:glycerol-3-phosphate O-acyltransferase